DVTGIADDRLTVVRLGQDAEGGVGRAIGVDRAGVGNRGRAVGGTALDTQAAGAEGLDVAAVVDAGIAILRQADDAGGDGVGIGRHRSAGSGCDRNIAVVREGGNASRVLAANGADLAVRAEVDIGVLVGLQHDAGGGGVAGCGIDEAVVANVHHVAHANDTVRHAIQGGGRDQAGVADRAGAAIGIGHDAEGVLVPGIGIDVAGGVEIDVAVHLRGDADRSVIAADIDAAASRVHDVGDAGSVRLDADRVVRVGLDGAGVVDEGLAVAADAGTDRSTVDAGIGTDIALVVQGRGSFVNRARIRAQGEVAAVRQDRAVGVIADLRVAVDGNREQANADGV